MVDAVLGDVPNEVVLVVVIGSVVVMSRVPFVKSSVVEVVVLVEIELTKLLEVDALVAVVEKEVEVALADRVAPSVVDVDVLKVEGFDVEVEDEDEYS